MPSTWIGRLACVLAAIGGLAAYPLSCWLWPYTRCGRCKGSGKKARKDGRVWRNCRRCRGDGKRLRIGRQLFNWAARKYKAGRT